MSNPLLDISHSPAAIASDIYAHPLGALQTILGTCNKSCFTSPDGIGRQPQATDYAK